MRYPAPDVAHPPLVVELCGLPGAGKTTVAHTLVARLHGENSPAHVVDELVSAATPGSRRLPRKVAMIGRALAADPLGEARAARLLGGGQRTCRDAVAVPARWWVAEQLVAAARRRTGVAVIEEGVVQALWTAGLWSRQATVPGLVGLALTTARPDLVVHVDSPVELALRRLRSRSSRHSRVQRLTDPEQGATMHEGDVLLRHLLAEWARRGLGEVVVLNGASGDLASVTAVLADVVEHRIAEPRARPRTM
jgi:thymidylate kinase